MNIFETDRVIIRRFELNDLNSVTNFWCDPEVLEFFPGGAILKEKVQKALERTIERYTEVPSLGIWAVQERASNEVIGHASLVTLDKTSDIELGYVLKKTSWGLGLGTEIAKGLIKHAFENLQMERIVAVTHPKNGRSISVIRKSKMQLVGPAHFYGIDVILFEILR